MIDLTGARAVLLQSLRTHGVADERVLAALARVPRERFLEPALWPFAYTDIALPIADGQTISQPLMVALMTQALAIGEHETALEIGTGSGYQTAVLAECAAWVVSVERLPALATAARALLTALGYRNIVVHEGDGSLGWPAEAPYQRILVTAAAPDVPAPLLAQLAVGGRMVVPVGLTRQQELMLIEQTSGGPVFRSLGPCAFVPLVGAAAWPEPPG
jgi:protein-L-isoaspartate(D-aspartate) O-methyltransferase